VSDEQVEPGAGTVASAGPAAAIHPPQRTGPHGRQSGGRRTFGVAPVFLVPAVILLGVLVVYPIVYTVIRSLFSASGDAFVGVENYGRIFTDGRTLTAIRNNAIWVVVAPSIVTALGLIFAVLTERVSWSTAFKVIVFMPMAISFLAAGVTFRLVYEQDPDRGLANAIITSVKGVFSESSAYPGARPRGDETLTKSDGGLRTVHAYQAGEAALLPLVALKPEQVPGSAKPAAVPALDGKLGGVVWLDFTRGGGGTAGQPDPTEKGLPGVEVQAVRDGKVVATAKTDDTGAFVFDDLSAGGYSLALPASNFAEPFRGVNWLGPTLVTPAIIGSYIWIWAGFAMVLIAAGLAAIPRDALEAARVDGGSEWQVFRHVTVPLLSPVLLVVLVTLVINVLKVFDLVLIIPPGSVQENATVLALEMWRVSFGGGQDQGLGSAIAVFLFVLVVPALLFNIRRFRREQ
jgi:alpha-glucoside transport system permease protein